MRPTIAVAALAVGTLGCATTGHSLDQAAAHLTPDTVAGWQAVFDGRSAQAMARFAPGGDDLLAAFGRATIAYERGDRSAAIADYLRVLTVAASDLPSAWAATLAPVATGRLVTMLQDVPDAPEIRAAEDRALGLPRHRLPWTAQVDLGRLGDRAARRRRDLSMLERLADTTGCARFVYQAGAGGRLPHVDLDGDPAAAAAPSPPPPAAWRWAPGAGCRFSIGSWDGYSGVQRLRAAVDVTDGTYDLVLEFGGEARWRIDGGPWQRHGSELTTGPSVAATAVRLDAGRHQIELRVGTVGGDAELGLMLLPARPEDHVRFVDPRAGATAATQRAPATPAPAATIIGPVAAFTAASATDSLIAWRPLFDYGRAFIADRVGDADGADAAVSRLSTQGRFALGLALSGAVAQNDVTRPASFARDAGLALMRLAVTVDTTLARAWHSLAGVELEDDRPRESIDDARAAIAAAPAWAAPELTLAAALGARGLELDADQALDRAAVKAAVSGHASCAAAEALVRRAEQRRDLRARDALYDRLLGCDSELDGRADRLRARGELPRALAWLRQVSALAPARDDLRAQLAAVLTAAGNHDAAVSILQDLAARAPRDVRLRIQLADALATAGKAAAAREILTALAATRPSAEEVRRVARAAGVPLPLDRYRLDGASVIAAFRQAGRRYEAPSVVVLDRSATRVLPGGEQLTLTHTIVLLQTKEAIDHWGEVSVPSGAEILLLRTHKPDGTTRDAEAISGKDSISAADLAIGDYLEWETLETKLASDAFPAGFLGDRFYFRSFDAPLDRSEFFLITPAAMPLDIDRRAGAPAGVRAPGPDGTVETQFVARQIPQLFAERSSVPAIEFVPSVRVSSGVTWLAWSRFLREQLYGTSRTSPAIRQLAATIAKNLSTDAGDRDNARAAAIVAWVTGHIEAADDLRDAAPLALARGRGNRLALVLALSRELGVPARPVLARSRLAGDTRRLPTAQELEDFADPLVAFDLPGPGVHRTLFADVRLKHASFGYLAPNLDGACTLSPETAQLGRAESRGPSDQRSIDMTIRLDENGGAQVLATEELTGWPALEWSELVDRLGSDRTKVRQDFEQRWLGLNFPGARLQDLDVDFFGAGQRAPRTPVPPAQTRSVQVRYTFASPNLGLRSDGELKLSPTFFRSQPGRRFAVEPTRQTALMMGYDVPLKLTATLQLPRAATVVDAAAGDVGSGPVARSGGYRFVEERTARPGSPERLILRREAALPIMRVPPEDYGAVAADLRRVDGQEQQEIRIRLQPHHGGATP